MSIFILMNEGENTMEKDERKKKKREIHSFSTGLDRRTTISLGNCREGKKGNRAKRQAPTELQRPSG